MDQDFIVFGAPEIAAAESAEVMAVLESRWLGTGPRVARFEAQFAAYKGVPKERVAAVNSCTAALHLSLIAAGIRPGDEVITTALTFCATVNAIIHAGGTPVLADVNPETMNIDPVAIAARITPRTRAIVVVHFAGRCCDMAPILDLADKHNLKVIEDCAHAIETEEHGRKAGTFGDFACFSFYVTKNVTTGEGGMVLARTEADIGRIKVLALHGMSKDAWKRFGDEGYKHYFVVDCGFKYNMMDLQAALGIHQLARVEASWRRRQEIWNCYQAAPDSKHAYHLYTLLIDSERAGIDRDTFLNRMTGLGIGVGVHYLSIPEHPYYRDRFGWRPEATPAALRIGRQTVSIPLSPALTDGNIERIIAGVHQALS